MAGHKQIADSTGRRKTRVFLVDDHPIVRRGFQVLFSLERDLEVCGEAEGASEAWQGIASLRPDVAVVDLSLKEGSGLELIRRLRAGNRKMRILVFSMHNEAAFVSQALQAGADAFVPKEQGGEQVLVTIRQLQGSPRDPQPAPGGFGLAASSPPAPEAPPAPAQGLSGRQLEVLQLLGKGLGTRQIAERLGMSPRTVDSHREHLKRKLHLKDAPALTHFALRFSSFGDAG